MPHFFFFIIVFNNIFLNHGHPKYINIYNFAEHFKPIRNLHFATVFTLDELFNKTSLISLVELEYFYRGVYNISSAEGVRLSDQSCCPNYCNLQHRLHNLTIIICVKCKTAKNTDLSISGKSYINYV